MTNYYPEARFDDAESADDSVVAEIVEADTEDQALEPLDMSFDSGVAVDAISYYIQKAGSHRIMERDEEVALAKQVERQTLGAKEEFMELNLKLVIKVATKYQGQGLELPDLIQEGNIGLMRAVEKFDWRKGFKFSTYAMWWIRQNIQRAIIDKGRTIRTPVHINESLNKVQKMKKFLESEHLPVTAEAIAAELVDLDASDVKALLDMNFDTLSLDAPVGEDQDGASFGNFIEDKDTDIPDEVMTEMRSEQLDDALNRYLNTEQRMIIKMRYGLAPYVKPHTLLEISEVIGLTRESIRQKIIVAEGDLARHLVPRFPEWVE